MPRTSLGPDELSTRGAFDLIDAIAEVARPVLVLSGGEPLFRRDIFDIAEYGVQRGFRMALASNGTLIDSVTARRIGGAGFSRVAVSIDGARPETHDRFRGTPGSHAGALNGLRAVRDEGVSIQVNSTIARHNVAELPALLDLALSIGADALHVFMLVPVGCGLEIAPAEMLPAEEYVWLVSREVGPHYWRALILPPSRHDGTSGAVSRRAALLLVAPCLGRIASQPRGHAGTCTTGCEGQGAYRRLHLENARQSVVLNDRSRCASRNIPVRRVRFPTLASNRPVFAGHVRGTALPALARQMLV